MYVEDVIPERMSSTHHFRLPTLDPITFASYILHRQLVSRSFLSFFFCLVMSSLPAALPVDIISTFTPTFSYTSSYIYLQGLIATDGNIGSIVAASTAATGFRLNWIG